MIISSATCCVVARPLTFVIRVVPGPLCLMAASTFFHMTPRRISSHGLAASVRVPCIILLGYGTARALSIPMWNGVCLKKATRVPAASALFHNENAPLRGLYVLILDSASSHSKPAQILFSVSCGFCSSVMWCTAKVPMAAYLWLGCSTDPTVNALIFSGDVP